MAQTLPNGATVVDSKIVGGIIIYLANRPHEYDSWVTWQANASDPGETYWGHYFSNEEEAIKDYLKRCGQ